MALWEGPSIALMNPTGMIPNGCFFLPRKSPFHGFQPQHKTWCWRSDEISFPVLVEMPWSNASGRSSRIVGIYDKSKAVLVLAIMDWIPFLSHVFCVRYIEFLGKKFWCWRWQRALKDGGLLATGIFQRWCYFRLVELTLAGRKMTDISGRCIFHEHFWGFFAVPW